MNELQVKTIELTPAKVEFNFDELSEVLDQQLAKYAGLEFTEKEVAACKKTITELNAGKKALNDYRLKTKKELSKEITDFEERCKHLSNKFDDVINPLKAQADKFEEDRRAEKGEKVQVIIDELVEKEGLNEKFASQLVIEKSHLNKSTTMKAIREDLETKAHHLGIAQDKEESDKQIIKMTVEIANERYSVNLLEQTYIRLLDHEDINEIKKIIMEDAQDEVDKKIEKVPIEAESKCDSEIFVEKYKVEGNDKQLNALEEYMSSHGLIWSVIEE